MKEKISHLNFLLSLNTIRIFCWIWSSFHFLIKKYRTSDLILYPHAQPGSDGYLRRFEEYFPFLKDGNLSYTVCTVTTDEEEHRYMNGNISDKYDFLKKCAWKRYRQVLLARHYKHAFVQRGLLLFFYDYNTPFLEKLLFRLCPDVTIDYWDAVWHRNKALVDNSARLASRISVVNDFLKDYFTSINPNTCLFPIGVNTNRYIVKSEYSIDTEAVLFYTGQPGNVKTFLALITPILLELKDQIPIKLRIISKARIQVEGISIEYHNFNLDTFFHLLESSDIGLYAVKVDDYTRGKMAMKVLDYQAAGLPCIATPCGLSTFAIDKENILFANTAEEWKSSLLVLLKDEALRKKLGQNGRKMILEKHSLPKSYETFKDIIFQ